MTELDRNGDHIPAVEGMRREIWAEPLTSSERQIMENVLIEGDLATTRRWLRFCLAIFAAQSHP